MINYEISVVFKRNRTVIICCDKRFLRICKILSIYMGGRIICKGRLRSIFDRHIAVNINISMTSIFFTRKFCFASIS